MAARKKTQSTRQNTQEKETQNVEKTLAEKVWDKIKDVDLGLFALPKQFVHKHVELQDGVPSSLKLSDTELHLKLTTDAALPQLEDVLPSVYWSDDEKLVLEQKENSKFVVVKVQQN